MCWDGEGRCEAGGTLRGVERLRGTVGRFSLLAVTVLALVAAGCLGDSSPKTVPTGAVSPGPPDLLTPKTVIVNPSTATVRATVVGGTPKLRSAIRRALAGMGTTMITRVAIVPADESYHPVPPGGVVLHFSYQQEKPKPRVLSDTLADWQAELVAQAARDTAIEQGLSPIVFFTGLGGQRVYAKDVLPQFEDPSPSYLAGRVTRAARDLGATVQSITVLRPRGFALRVDLSVSNPKAFVRHDWENFVARAFPSLASIKTSIIDGWFVRIRSGGRVCFAASSENRGPWGGVTWRSPLLRQSQRS